MVTVLVTIVQALHCLECKWYEWDSEAG